MATGSNTKAAEALRARVMAEAQGPMLMPYFGSRAAPPKKKPTAATDTFDRGESEGAFQTQRAGEREDLTGYLQQLDLPGGSKRFTMKEVKRGYRKLGKA